MEGNFGFQGKLKTKKITAPENRWLTKAKLYIRRKLQKLGLFMPTKDMTNMFGKLSMKKITADGQFYDYGVVSQKKVTDVFVNYLVDAMQTTGMMNIFRWHACGFSTAAESSTDQLLTAETTETRDYGTSTEGATANIYSTVATHTFQNASTVGEHGLFDSSGTSTGTLVDRSMFAGIAVSSGDQIQFTYELTCVSSG